MIPIGDGPQGAEVLKDAKLERVQNQQQMQTDLQNFFSRYITKLDAPHQQLFQQYLTGPEVASAIDKALASHDTMVDTRFRIGCKIADQILAKDNQELALKALIKIHRDRFGKSLFNEIDMATLDATLKKDGWQKASSLVNSIAFQYTAKNATQLPLQELMLKTSEGDNITIKREDSDTSKEIGLVNYYKQKEPLDKSFGNKGYEVAKGMLYAENLIITVTKPDGKEQKFQSNNVSDIASDKYETIVKKILDSNTVIITYN